MNQPENLLEKEYYFDETLGQSLQEHCDEIKQQFPGMQVQTRRDRDGFAIVKTLFKREYKYNLDRIEQWDPEVEMDKIRSSIEHFLNEILPGTTEDAMQTLGENLEDIVKQASHGSIDAFSKL